MNKYTMEQWKKDKTFKAHEYQEVSCEVYYEMMNSVPPIQIGGIEGYMNCFLVGEPYDIYDIDENGNYIYTYSCFGEKDGKYYFLGRRVYNENN